MNRHSLSKIQSESIMNMKNRDIASNIVQHRDVKLNFAQDEIRRHWFGNDPWLTHLFNGLFFAVPDGERWVMESARKQMQKIDDPGMKDIIRAFIRQEASHSREHDAVNAMMTAIGLPADRIEAMFASVRKKIQARCGDDMQASIAAAIEHFTAVLSEVMLQHPELFSDMDEKTRALVYWHMVEETEHKSVSHDIYSATVGTDTRAWLLRSYGLFATTAFGFPVVIGGQFYLLAKDGELGNLKSAAKYLNTLFGEKAVMTRILASTLDYLRPNFHPWDRDNREAVKIWRDEFDRTGDAITASNTLYDWQMQKKFGKKVKPVRPLRMATR